MYHVEREQWAQYAFDTKERVKAGKRSHEWTAIALTEVAVVREMAGCLRLIGQGKVPEEAKPLTDSLQTACNRPPQDGMAACPGRPKRH